VPRRRFLLRTVGGDGKGPADDARGRRMTPSRTGSPSGPEDIEGQPSRGGPCEPVSSLWDASTLPVGSPRNRAAYTPAVIDPPPEDFPDDAFASEARLAWEVPEIAAASVLVAVAALIAGGIVAGIVASTASYGPATPSRLTTGTAISFGSLWAGPLVAVALLAVVGLCWWQSEAWADASEPDDGQDRALQVTGHIRRAIRLSRWALAALPVTLVGAISLVVSSVLQTFGVPGSPGSLNWSRIVLQVAGLLAVVVVSTAGFWIARQIDDGQVRSD